MVCHKCLAIRLVAYRQIYFRQKYPSFFNFPYVDYKS